MRYSNILCGSNLAALNPNYGIKQNNAVPKPNLGQGGWSTWDRGVGVSKPNLIQVLNWIIFSARLVILCRPY